MFRAYDAERDRLVAVKLFKLDLPPERAHLLVAEFDRLIAADLVHPALIQPLATGIHDVCPYLVQEYVAADSLDLVVREYGAAPPGDALRVAAQLAGALDFAAAVSITHGALHPRDVLLSSDDTRLTGVGIAQALERVGVTVPLRRPYTPPERLAGGAWNRRADVFGLAVLIHELLWVRRLSGLGANALDGFPEIPGGDHAALRTVFARALAEHPGERFETALAFADALALAFPTVVIPQPPVVSPQSSVVREPSPVHDSPATVRASQFEAPRLPLLDNLQEIALPFASALADPPVDLSLSIAAAEEERYRDAETAPALVGARPSVLREPQDRPEHSRGPAVSAREPALAAAPSDPVMWSRELVERAKQEPLGREPEIASALERSRSATWPLVLALAVGLTIGFAAGYGVGTREPGTETSAEVIEPPADTPPAPAGREFTESTVAAPAPAAPAKPDAGSTTLAADGRLLVRSTPAGARVFVNGKEYGPTPVAVRDLAQGTHRVRILRDGYSPEERRVVITAARPSQSLTVSLTRPGSPTADRANARAGAPGRSASPADTPPRFSGALIVISRPAGASVFLDGRLVGTTPLSLPAVAAGSHAIRLEHDGYRRWTSAVRVVASEQNRVTASLER